VDKPEATDNVAVSEEATAVPSKDDATTPSEQATAPEV